MNINKLSLAEIERWHKEARGVGSPDDIEVIVGWLLRYIKGAAKRQSTNEAVEATRRLVDGRILPGFISKPGRYGTKCDICRTAGNVEVTEDDLRISLTAESLARVVYAKAEAVHHYKNGFQCIKMPYIIERELSEEEIREYQSTNADGSKRLVRFDSTFGCYSPYFEKEKNVMTDRNYRCINSDCGKRFNEQEYLLLNIPLGVGTPQCSQCNGDVVEDKEPQPPEPNSQIAA